VRISRTVLVVAIFIILILFSTPVSADNEYITIFQDESEEGIVQVGIPNENIAENTEDNLSVYRNEEILIRANLNNEPEDTVTFTPCVEMKKYEGGDWPTIQSTCSERVEIEGSGVFFTQINTDIELDGYYRLRVPMEDVEDN